MTALQKTLDWKHIKAAYADAVDSSMTAVQKAILCGQMLREKREEMARAFGHRTPSTNGRNQHSEGDGFIATATAELGASKVQIYAWMKAAERTDSVLQLSNCIDVETVSLSTVLASNASSKARQLFLDFTADKTLADCLRDVIDGESPDHRIARAYNGKNAAGAGGSGDRKEFEKFAALKIKHLTTFVRAKLTVNQKSLIVAALNTALELWPRWLLEALADKCRSELKLSDQDRASRKDF